MMNEWKAMRLQSFTQWILPTPIQPCRDPGSSRLSKLRLPPGAFLPSFLSLYFFFLLSSPPFFFLFFSRYEPRLKKRGSIGKSRLDCTIEPCMSQSGKTRYRGRFRSRVFGLVYQKPWVIPFGLVYQKPWSQTNYLKFFGILCCTRFLRLKKDKSKTSLVRHLCHLLNFRCKKNNTTHCLWKNSLPSVP